MLVVPLEKDSILTKDGVQYTVVEYTNFKDGGPAVYGRGVGDDDVTLIYFFDIEKINNTQVEYQRGSKVFNALGKIKRAQHLPQPDDKVTIGEQVVEVKSLKLKSKNLGVNKGLFIRDDEDNNFRIKDILDIDRSLGGSDFNREAFLQIYKDYAGV